MLSDVIVGSPAIVEVSHQEPDITEVNIQLQIAVHQVPKREQCGMRAGPRMG